MATCSLCGKPAGWFKSQHEECVAKHDAGLAAIVASIRDVITGRASAEGGAEKIKGIAEASHIQPSEIKSASVQAWEAAVDHFLDDGLLSVEEEQRLFAYAEGSNLTPEILNSNGAYARVRKSAVLRDVHEGRLPANRDDLPSTSQLNFQRGEALIWAIDGVDYYEDRTKTHYEGRSQGVSFRVIKGVYYRVGAFKGRPVETQERIHVDSGVLAVTTKHLYFAGDHKSLRIPHDKIVSITPYSDGVAIHRDAASAKPQLFKTGDGWFIHNLLANAPNVEVGETLAQVESDSRGILGTPKRH